MKNKLIIICLFTFIFYGSTAAQDPIFTQFHSIPTLLNPSFSGASGNSRMNSGYRLQWLDYGNKITTQFASFDTWSESLNSGIGVSIRNHTEEFTKYNFTQIDLSYSYHVKLTREWTFLPGLSLGYGIKSFNFQGMLLGDQIDIVNGSFNQSSIDQIFNSNQVHFVDASTSFLLYNEKIWLGASIKHLNRPNISFSNGGNLPLSMFFSLHGGYLISLSPKYRSTIFDETNLFLTFNYMQQSRYNRLDFGAQIEIENLSFGILVSTIPAKMDADSHTLSSINAILGFKFSQFKVGISNDFSTSDIGKMGGTYEITLQYNFENIFDGFKRPRRLKCIPY
jgi:type IX secretion system PorP/SprF family membrane protein